MRSLSVFDLDGTLYTFDNSDSVNFTSSRFYGEVKRNAYAFLARRLNLEIDKAQEIYEQIKRDFKGEVSLGLESRFGIDRYEWFNETWNLDPKNFIRQENIKPLIDSLDMEVAILTAAPRVWASKVLDYLGLSEYKGRLFTGEPDLRKPNPIAFMQVCDSVGVAPNRALSIGDQVESDILPAKYIGMKGVLVRSYSDMADYCIESLDDLSDLVKRLDI